jgi:hypothetical protein
MESAKSTPTHLKVSEQMKHAIEDEKEENVDGNSSRRNELGSII